VSSGQPRIAPRRRNNGSWRRVNQACAVRFRREDGDAYAESAKDVEGYIAYVKGQKG
jgi:hypothetical protein